MSGQLRRATLASSDALRDALLTHCIVLADETPLQMLTSGAKKLIELLSETMPLVGSPTWQRSISIQPEPRRRTCSSFLG